MTRTILDVHILQTVPPNNINRDDTGSPKTAYYGGALRSRVSSQAWKRATRSDFTRLLHPAELGTRTKRVAEFLTEHIEELDSSIERNEAWKLAAETIKAATGSKVEPPKRSGKEEKEEGDEVAPQSSYLMFLSARQREALAQLAVEGRDDITGFFKDKENKNRARRAADTNHSVDIALFGRMVADGADINVDAAAQVAHAISVHAAENDADYYTAVDDHQRDEESGAGMIGTIEFNSATLYRYAALDVDQLRRNLGEGLREGEDTTEPVRRAVRAFLHGFVESMPTGKINTFGNHTLPEAVIVKLRDARPVNFVSAFEEPVPEEGGGYLRQACQRLATHIPEIERNYGMEEETRTWVLRIGGSTAALDGLGTTVTMNELAEEASAEAAGNWTETN
ncbi:CRISPR system Cascade subunit CasC [Haloactinospora alba]|uniref:CRISPR system Cascade subunit CasC n=1 Tax=Haloactinospora alba TaxID=405555 RepID=A0A543NH51_9ACTN|nr:type I-E CRISPR-associated protein Cas7/Cse4/CasC [Haloactinospora alba]TQN31178.1 CRISPR system Cascade subunit CasC [Haloactinospora alba]